MMISLYHVVQAVLKAVPRCGVPVSLYYGFAASTSTRLRCSYLGEHCSVVFSSSSMLYYILSMFWQITYDGVRVMVNVVLSCSCLCHRRITVYKYVGERCTMDVVSSWTLQYSVHARVHIGLCTAILQCSCEFIRCTTKAVRCTAVFTRESLCHSLFIIKCPSVFVVLVSLIRLK